MRTLEETLKNATHIHIRDYKRYSFGNKEECKALFIEAFMLVDKTIKEYEHLPEYDNVIDWLSDTEFRIPRTKQTATRRFSMNKLSKGC